MTSDKQREVQAKLDALREEELLICYARGVAEANGVSPLNPVAVKSKQMRDARLLAIAAERAALCAPEPAPTPAVTVAIDCRLVGSFSSPIGVGVTVRNASPDPVEITCVRLSAEPGSSVRVPTPVYYDARIGREPPMLYPGEVRRWDFHVVFNAVGAFAVAGHVDFRCAGESFAVDSGSPSSTRIIVTAPA